MQDAEAMTDTDRIIDFRISAIVFFMCVIGMLLLPFVSRYLARRRVMPIRMPKPLLAMVGLMALIRACKAWR
jgi:hypothetical protein